MSWTKANYYRIWSRGTYNDSPSDSIATRLAAETSPLAMKSTPRTTARDNANNTSFGSEHPAIGGVFKMEDASVQVHHDRRSAGDGEHGTSAFASRNGEEIQGQRRLLEERGMLYPASLRRTARVGGFSPVRIALPGAACSSRSIELSGEATHGGKPIPAGRIYFTPDSAKGNNGPQGFAPIKDGRYDTRNDGHGAVAGPMVVRYDAQQRRAPSARVWVFLSSTNTRSRSTSPPPPPRRTSTCRACAPKTRKVPAKKS